LVLEAEAVELEGRRLAGLVGLDHRLAAAGIAADRVDRDGVVPVDPATKGFDRLEPEALNGSNSMELRVFGSEKHRQAVLVARLDNLGKGASGAAVQSLEMMLGLA
ncbi:MAG: hypothetical protein ACKOUS_12285, partial [Alphaproteobacteria bacterium]